MRFGGAWTEQKLEKLEKYLKAYRRIFDVNEKAQHFTTMYIDAFAGCGYRTEEAESIEPDECLFPEASDEETHGLYRGSPRIALELSSKFDKYVFIDNDPNNIAELRDLKREYGALSDSITVYNEDANVKLGEICRTTDWTKHRAVTFLDPCGMQVGWELIESVAATKAVDLWFLFPLGSSVMRLLTRNELPRQGWSEALTKALGTEEWKEEFYSATGQLSLFGEPSEERRTATVDVVADFVVRRLRSIFAAVAPHPLILRNSRNSPIFMLCFAAANEKGAETAVRIARYLLEN